MKYVKLLELSFAAHLKLENGYDNGPTHNYLNRCKSILLESSGKIAEIFDVTVSTVYAWIKRIEKMVSKTWEHVQTYNGLFR